MSLTTEMCARLFGLSLDILVVAGLDGYLRLVNDSYARITGWTEEELLSRSFFEVIHPDDQAVATAELARLAGGEETVGLELRMLRKSGGYRWIRWTAKPVPDEALVYAVGTDVTERKQAEGLVAINAAIIDRVLHDEPLPQVLEALVRAVEAESDGMIGSVLLVSDDGQSLRHGAAPNLPDAYNQAIDGITIGVAVGSCGTAAHRRQPVVVVDTQTDPLWADFRELAAEHGLRACWSTPILSTDGTPLATFALYYREPRAPEADDERLIAAASHLVSVAVEHARARHQRRRSDERFRTIAAEVPVGIFEADPTGANVYANEQLCTVVGLSADDLKGKGWIDHVHPDDRARVMAEWDHAVASAVEWNSEYRIRRPDGTVRHAAASARSMRDATAVSGFLGSVTDVTVAKEAAVQRLALEREQEIAQTLQRSLLPRSIPTVAGIELAARYVAGAAGMEVGGDWYDAFTLPGERLAIAIGDVAGRGLPAATVMGQLRVMLRSVAHLEPSVSTAIARLSELTQDLPTQFTTAVYGVLDLRSLALTYANAGHPPPVVRRPDGETFFLTGGRCLPLGVEPSHAGTHETVQLEPGTTVLLYTDGLIERRDRPITDDLEVLRDLVARCDDPPEDLCERIMSGFATDSAGDDVAVLALRIR